MKSNLITRILLLALCLVFMLSALTACGNKEDVEIMKQDIDAVESQVGDNIAKIETLETKEVVAELKALADQIKLTADAAATQTALAEAIAKLEAADSAKATSEVLTEAKTALEEALKANGDADAKTKDELTKAIASVKETADAAATAAALEEVKATLENADTTNAKTAADALAAAKEALEAKDATNATAAADALAAAKTALEAADVANAEAAATALADAKAVLEAAIAANAASDEANKTAAAAALAAAKATLTTADETNAAAAATALATAQETLAAADTANAIAAATALENAQTALNATIAANKADAETALNNAKTEITSAYTTAITNATAEVNATVSAMDSAYKAADAAISNELAALSAKHNTLSGKVDVLEALIGDVGDTTVAAEITLIKNQLALLGGDIAVTMDEFVVGYDLASKILAGEAVVGDFADETEYNTYKDLTLNSFDAQIRVITDRKVWYYDIGGVAATQYDEFDVATKNIRFFLGRATSKESVATLFGRLQNAIDDLMTLDEIFVAVVDDIIENKKVTNEVESYEIATAVKSKIDEVGGIVIAPEYLDKYTLIVKAQENLAAAFAAVETDVNVYIDVIDSPVVYGVSEGEIETAREKFDAFKELYFTRTEVAEYVALYNDELYTAELIVDDYAVLTAAESRIVELNNAKAAKPTIIDAVLNFETDRPLWSDYTAIKTLDDTIADWTDGKEGDAGWAALEAENVEAILGAGMDALVDKALGYANYMNDLYNSFNADDALKNKVIDFNDEVLQLYSRYAEFAETRTKLNTLETKIGEHVDFDAALDSNFASMIGDDNITAFRGDAVNGQMERLNTANTDINGYKMAIGNLITNDGGADDVDIYDYDTVAGIKSDIIVAYTIPSIQIGDANYNLIVKPAMDEYNRWMDAYKAKTAAIAEIYSAVEKGMTVGYTLAEGNEVVRINDMVLELVRSYGVGNLNVKVYIGEAPTYVVLEDVVDDWNAFAGSFRTKAELAQSEAVAVNALITNAFKNLSTDNLNNYAEITAAYATFTAWADAHIGGVYTWDAVNAIQAINKVNAPTEVYTFVNIETFEILDEMNTEVVAREALSNVEWNAVSDKFAALADKWSDDGEVIKSATEWDIHSKSDFEAAENAYNKFVTKFYTNANAGVGTVADGVGYNGEVAAYALFTEEYSEFTTLMVTVDGEFSTINSAINTLMTSGLSAVDATDVSGIAAIRTAIADFKSDYNCDVLTCTGGYAITAEQRIFLARAQAKAAYTEKYNEAVVDAAGDSEKLTKLQTALDNANQLIVDAVLTGPTNTIESVYDFTISNFEAALA